MGFEPIPTALERQAIYLFELHPLLVFRLMNFKLMEREIGFEPMPLTWRASTLPLSYTRSQYIL